jgi:CHASE3 domain sensor protein
VRGGLTSRMVIASSLLALLTSVAFVVLLLAIRDQRSSAQLARHSQEVLAAANRVERLLVDIETGTRGYLLTREDRFLQPAHAGEAGFAQASSKLVDLTRIPEQNQAPARLTSIHVSGTARAFAADEMRRAWRRRPGAASPRAAVVPGRWLGSSDSGWLVGDWRWP